MYKGLMIMLLGIIPALGGIEATTYMSENGYSSFSVSLVKWVSVILMAGLMLYGANKFRCPSCNTLVAGRYSSSCPKCGTKVW